MKKIAIILLVLFIGSYNAYPQSKKLKAERAKLEGFWAYKDAPRSCILRQADKAGEQLGELDILVQYDIIWKDGLDHDLVVTKVFPGENTPMAVMPNLYKIGEALHVQVLKVKDDYYRYSLIYKNIKQKDQYLYRIPKEQSERVY
jgi:hypothetical protein